MIVTDRKSLDQQIEKTFRHCGKEVKRARTGTELADAASRLPKRGRHGAHQQVQDRRGARSSPKSEGKNIFVLVDESHRTQYGTLHALMRKVLP